MSQAFRIEKDTMGEMRVPADAYYGAQTARALENFPVSGQAIPRPVIRALGILKGAAATVNMELGGLAKDLGAAIERAAAEVAEGKLDRHFVVDVFQTGSGTSSNMNANEVIANRAGELLGKALGSKAVHPNDHVNMGQSSNDVFPTAVQLGLALTIQEQLLPELGRLAEALHGLADRTFAQVKTGRTHLMDAMPIRYGQEFRGYAGQVERGAARIGQALEDLCEVPLGGTAVGTGVNADPRLAQGICKLVARDHGVRLRETTNHFQAQACLDAVVHASGALRAFATGFYKFANDIRWMSSSIMGELKIPEVQPGSSIMPAKVNPVICESVLMLCGQVFANDGAVAFGNSQGQFELNTMMPFVARNAIESATLLAHGARMFREKCLAGVEVTAEAARRVHRNPILATALNKAIGYEHAAKIAKEAAAKGLTVREIAAQQTQVPPAELDRLLDPARLCGEWGKSR
ncbi:MAG: class II fumarate hydratase [Planctomycetes bacterium]|nr:class II fumarate hydratase [Planctomycetota bacterium]